MFYFLNLSKTKKIIAVVIFVLLLGIGLYLFFPNIFMASPQLKDFSKQPRPAPILPTGQQTYEVIQQDFTYQPKIRFVSLYPVDPKEGEEQKIIVQVDAYSKPVSVVASVISDNEPKELKLSEVQNPTLNLKQRYFVGDDNNLAAYTNQKVYREDVTNKFNLRAGVVTAVNISTSSYRGDGPAPTSTTINMEAKPINLSTELKTYEFSTSWTVAKDFESNPSLTISVKEDFQIIKKKDNPRLKIDPKFGITSEILSYAKANNIPLQVEEKSKQELFNSIRLSWVDSCNTPLGGNWEADTVCAATYPDGVDGGSLRIASTGNLIFDADLAINPGKSIVFAKEGVLILNRSKEIKNAYIWKEVSDSNGTRELIGLKTPGRKYLRRYSFQDKTEGEILGLNANGQLYKVPTGKQEFSVSSGVAVDPKFIQGEINPLDVRPGDMQTMKIVVQSEKEIASVVAKIETDEGIVEVPMKFEGKTAQKDIRPNPYLINEKSELVIVPVETLSEKIAESPLIKVSEALGAERLAYSGSWVVKDTISKRYRTTFVATNVDGKENSMTMAWSDPCETTNTYTTSNYYYTCTAGTNEIHGNARGNVAIGRTTAPVYNPTVTLGSGSTLFTTPGNSISILGTSQVVLAGGQIRIAYAYGYDGDADDWAIGYITLSDTTSVAAQYKNLQTVNIGWTDCIDSDPLVNPGSGGQDYPGANGWDWNCDGQTNMATAVFTASCDGQDGCMVCNYYHPIYGCTDWTCAYWGMPSGVSPGYCGCDNQYIDGCANQGGVGSGFCESQEYECGNYIPNVIYDPYCATCY